MLNNNIGQFKSYQGFLNIQKTKRNKVDLLFFFAFDDVIRFFLGHDNTVLNEMGKQQVELVGNRFKYEHLTRIYSSDLERAFKASVLTY